MKDRQCVIAIKWLLCIEKQKNIRIIHAAKEQETVLRGVRVDGYCADTYEVFEFQGCYYHGCPLCFKFARDEPIFEDSTTTFNLRYEATKAKISKLQSFGYTVNEMWECEFRKQLKGNPEMEIYTKSHPLFNSTTLNPRDAFYGGRTGNIWEFYETKEGEKIKYVDVCSLYPFICKYGKFPIGHPQVIVGEACEKIACNNTNGLIKCRVLAPYNLYHPVLPQKMSNKLMFVLYRSCGLGMSNSVCSHNIEERALEGTWVFDEVLKAVEKGYQIIHIYEIWKYSVEAFNKTTGEKGLFTDMMDTFIKIKQEASNWPENCTSEESRNKYIKDFFEKEGVKLEYAQITENPGLRSLAKLILNSFRGKFGQREYLPKTKIIINLQIFFQCLLTLRTILLGQLLLTKKQSQ